MTPLVAVDGLGTVEALFEPDTTDDESVTVVPVGRFEGVVGTAVTLVSVLAGIEPGAVGLDKLDPDVEGTEDK